MVGVRRLAFRKIRGPSAALGMTQNNNDERQRESSHGLRAREYHRRVKTNPFPWFPWWPKVEESHYVPIIVIALVLTAVLIYFSGI
jgi:hypothetical protein